MDTVAGRAALRVFTRLITRDNYRDMGFESIAEIRSATLGAQLPEYMIQLDELQHFQAGQAPESLLHSTGRVTWLVLVSGRTRSSMTLSRGSRGWGAVGYGAPHHARIVDSVLALLASRPGGGGQYREVLVPALNTTFLGSVQAGQLFLTPVLSDQRFKFQSGSTLPAAQALLLMVPAAQAHKDVPS
ncbi:MAG TPA: hypothetical protein VI653_18760 [Steroidobacteraceae bacterium]